MKIQNRLTIKLTDKESKTLTQICLLLKMNHIQKALCSAGSIPPEAIRDIHNFSVKFLEFN